MASASKVQVWQRASNRIGQTAKIADENATTVVAEACRACYDDILGEIFEACRWRFARRQAPLSSVASQAKTYAYDASLTNTDWEIPFSFIETTQVTVEVDGSELDPDTDYSIQQADPATATLAKVILGAALTAGQTVTITVESAREGWEQIYALPSDCVEPIALVADGDRYELDPVDERLEFEVMADDAGTGQIIATNVEQGDDFDVLIYTALIDYVPAWPSAFLNAVVTRLEEELWRAVPKDLVRADEARKRFVLALDQARVNDRRLGHSNAPETDTLRARKA